MGILTVDIAGVQADIDRKWQGIVGVSLAILKLATPIDTGNARLNWVVDPSGDYRAVIVNRVDYIEELEAGRSSQAPDGITGPALPLIERAAAEIAAS